VISDDEVEKAIDFLRDNSPKVAQAAANRVYMEEYRKVVKSRLMREHDDKPLGAQEREAYADPRYEQHLKAMQESVEKDEYLQWMMTAAETKISAWQTQSRNTR
jgi:hypothetical protein